MVVNIQDQNLGLVTLSDSSRLELMLLDPDLPEEGTAAFVALHNEAWKFHPTDNETFRNRICRGTIIGGYLDKKPSTLLETTSLNLEGIAEIERKTSDYSQRAYEVAKLLHSHMRRGYDDLTNKGKWFSDETDSNVLIMVDITTAKKFEGKGLAGALVDYFKALMLEQNGFKRPSNLHHVQYILSLTPKPTDYTDTRYRNGIVSFHNVSGAFNTGYVWENARPGHPEPDAILMCYLAPGYVPKSRNLTIQRVDSGMPIMR